VRLAGAVTYPPTGNQVDYDNINVNTSGNHPRKNNGTTGTVGPADSDGDGVLDNVDNCPAVSNAGQENADGDSLGDACDTEGPSPNTNGTGGADDCGDTVDNDGDGDTDAADAGCAGGPDADGDGVTDVADNCPSWPNPAQNLPAWPVPANDADCDGFTNSSEGSLTTDPDDACGFTAGGATPSESWPPDLVPTNTITIQDVLALKPVFGGSSPRHDLVISGSITIQDVLAIKPYFGKSCT
jgi:hypothetical protein